MDRASNFIGRAGFKRIKCQPVTGTIVAVMFGSLVCTSAIAGDASVGQDVEQDVDQANSQNTTVIINLSEEDVPDGDQDNEQFISEDLGMVSSKNSCIQRALLVAGDIEAEYGSADYYQDGDSVEIYDIGNDQHDVTIRCVPYDRKDKNGEHQAELTGKNEDVDSATTGAIVDRIDELWQKYDSVS